MTRITEGAAIDTPAGRGVVLTILRHEWWSKGSMRMERSWSVVADVGGERRTFTAHEIVEHNRGA